MSDILNIGFTGTKDGLTEHQKSTLAYFLRELPKPSNFRHGDGIGADYTAHGMASKFGFNIIIHPPIQASMRGYASNAFSVLPAKTFLERDQDIVKSSDRLFAAVQAEEDKDPKSGVWLMIRQAVQLGVPVTIIYPNGIYEDRFPWESVEAAAESQP